MKTLSPFLLLISVSRRLRPRLTEEVAYDVTFAFVYNAFFPGRKIHVNRTPVGGMGAAPRLPGLCLAVIHG